MASVRGLVFFLFGRISKKAEKRKRVFLGFNRKLEIVKRLEKGETAANIALQFNKFLLTVYCRCRDPDSDG